MRRLQKKDVFPREFVKTNLKISNRPCRCDTRDKVKMQPKHPRRAIGISSERPWRVRGRITSRRNGLAGPTR